MIRLSCRPVLLVFACAAPLACATPLAVGPANAQALGAFAPAANEIAKQLVFAIVRNGSKIGQYKIHIEQDGKTQTVDFTTDIKVAVLMFTAYRLHHSGREIWTDGKFVSYKGTTNDNGKMHAVSLLAGPQAETLVVDGRHSQAPKGALPASMWNSKFLNATVLVDPDTGKQTAVKTDDMGMDSITVMGAPEQAHHFHIEGLGRDVWMVKGSPVRFQLKGTDNSTIVSELQPPTQATP